MTKTITHREFRTWQAWRRDQLNNPDRHDYYLMQIAGYVKHVMSNRSWSPNNFKIHFETGKETSVIKQLKLDRAKRRWGVEPEEDD